MNRRGLTLIELLVALMLLAVAVSGLMGLWSFGFNTTKHSQDLGVAYNIARREIEKARNVSFMVLPEGTQTVGYDGSGSPTSQPSPHYTVTTIMRTIPDVNGQINALCLREFSVRVASYDSRDTLFETVTHFTRGGI
jgi:prepilin-type N-terminal cleavage/methylation domain-containing protein